MEERTVGGVTSVRIGRGVLSVAVEDTPARTALLVQPGAAVVGGALEETARASGSDLVSLELPDGEAAKTLAVVENTAGLLAAAGLSRDGLIVAVGGGALTDVAGFLASVYMRGIRVRYVPTTLLGAVDASIGGKTAVNVGGKNLIGTFTHPEMVVIDNDVLSALPDDLRRDGLSEAYKAGLIRDPLLAELIETDHLAVDLDQVVARAIDVKIGVVDEDFREAGRRAHLNFGHTIGHAVEILTGWRHGSAVAVGMAAAAAASEHRVGFAESARIVETVAKLGLPVEAPGLDRAEVERLLRMDKKADSTGLNMVLLERVGSPVVTHVDMATLDAALRAIGIT